MDVGGVAPPSVPATAGKLRLVLSFPPAPPVELPKIGHVQIPPMARAAAAIHRALPRVANMATPVRTVLHKQAVGPAVRAR